MSRQTIILLGLLFGISSWLLWERLPATQHIAAGESSAISPLANSSPLQPAATPSVALEISDDWLTYTHPTWGISFRYPSDWEVEGPESIDDSAFTPEQRDQALTLGHSLTLSPVAQSPGAQSSVSGNSWRQVTIALEEYTLSPAGSLEEWVTLRNEWSESGGISTDPLHLFKLPSTYLPSELDQAIYSILESDYRELHTIWLADEGLVYSIQPYYAQPEDIALIYQLAASMEFDSAQQESLRERAKFAGDEEELRQFNESMHSTQDVPSNDSPLATATPSRRDGSTSHPIIPVPTPRVYATVTPSAAESPLVNGLQHFQGNAFFGNLPPFELWYDPTDWQLAEGANEGKYLLHQKIRGCELNLFAAPQGAIAVAQTTLAGNDWGVFVTGTNRLGYSLRIEDGNYIFDLALPTPVPTQYDPENKSVCEQDAETMIDTFAILGSDGG